MCLWTWNSLGDSEQRASEWAKGVSSGGSLQSYSRETSPTSCPLTMQLTFRGALSCTEHPWRATPSSSCAPYNSGKWHSYCDFIEEETEAERSKVTWPSNTWRNSYSKTSSTNRQSGSSSRQTDDKHLWAAEKLELENTLTKVMLFQNGRLFHWVDRTHLKLE